MKVSRRQRLPMAACFLLVLACLAITLLPRFAHGAKKQKTGTFAYSFMPYGVISGQTARVSIANPHAAPPDPCDIVFYDTAGDVLASTGAFQLPAVQKTLFFDFPYQALANPTGAGGRAQVRAVLYIASESGYPPNPCFSSEIMDQSTGATLVFIPQNFLELPAVQ